MDLIRKLYVKADGFARGQTMAEYALIVAAIGLALIATVDQLSTAVVSLYQSIVQGVRSIGAGGQ